MTLRELLQAGRDRVAQGWCQGSFYRAKKGGGTDYCALGALTVEAPAGRFHKLRMDPFGAWLDVVREGSDLLHSLVPAEDSDNCSSDPDDLPGLTTWNDAAGRTQEEVVALYDHALAALGKLEAEGKESDPCATSPPSSSS